MDLLAGMPFVVVSTAPAAAYAAWLLTSLGARVDHTTTLDPEGLGAFLGEGATFVPAATPPAALDPGAILITDLQPRPDHRAALEALAVTSTVVWIVPRTLDLEPTSGDAALEGDTDLCLHAEGGWMSAVGDPGREPLGPPGSQGRMVAGLFAAIDALVAAAPAAACANPAPGLHLVPILDAVAATCIYDAVGFQYHGVIRQRVGNRFNKAQSVLVTLPCDDGYVGMHATLHSQWLKLCDLIGRPDMPADPRFADPISRSEHPRELDVAFLAWLQGRTRWEVYHAVQGAGVPATAVPSLGEVLASPQLAARDYWREVSTPRGARLRIPGPPLRVTGVAAPPGHPHEHPHQRLEGPWRPGALRVVDLAHGWAGPMVSHVLACYGADVIKVEGPTRFDWWRGSRPPGFQPEAVLHERSHVFNTLNRTKRGVTLDLASPEGASLARRLISTAEVVVENFRPGVLERLGLGPEVLLADNPGLIVVRQPGYGATGPESSYRVFGNTIEGMSGLTALLGYEEGPVFSMSNALGDPVSGLHGVLAALAALVARGRDGRGRAIESAQLEGFVPFLGAELIAWQRGAPPQRQGNRRNGAEPSGAFPAAGDDRWLVIEVQDDAAWKALAAIIAEPWAQAPRFETVAGRAAARTEIHAALFAFTVCHDRDALVAKLRTAGVAAAPVNNEADLLHHEALTATGFWQGCDRAYVGHHLYPTLPVLHGRARLWPDGPAPLLGEHTRDVLAALGEDEAALDRLQSSGVI